MKIIFLDIEGVLNTESTYKQVNEYGIYIDEFRIAYLKQIVEAVKLWKTNYVSVRKLLLEINNKKYIFSHKLKFIKIKDKFR